jgi:hypothetical protein
MQERAVKMKSLRPGTREGRERKFQVRIRLLQVGSLALGLFWWLGVAAAHEFWLTPSSYQAGPGATIDVQACVGTGFRGEVLPYSPARTVRFELEGDRKIDLTAIAVNGSPSYATFALPDSGGAVLLYHSNFTAIELPAELFDRYLALEGLDDALRARRGVSPEPPGRERFRRCAKVWIAGRDGARVTRAYGLPLEIVPLRDPSLPVADLAVRVLSEGRPCSQALVRAWRQPVGSDGSLLEVSMRDSVGPATVARSDEDGVAHLRIDQPGEWLVNVVRMKPVRASTLNFGGTQEPPADWESSWASLTFRRREDAR